MLADVNSIGDLGGMSRSNGVSILAVGGSLLTAPGEGKVGGAAETIYISLGLFRGHA